MKLIDALLNVDKSQSQYADREELARELGLPYLYYGDLPEDFDERVKAYYVIKWNCTDTWVGLMAIYFDDRLAGYSWQTARKSDTEYEFVSEELALELRAYLESTLPKPKFNIIDPEEEQDEYYTVAYGSQLLVDKGFYNGEPVEVVKKFPYHPSSNWKNVEVKNTAGAVMMIPLSEFQIPLHLNPELKTE
jgi:hypothetical protein